MLTLRGDAKTDSLKTELDVTKVIPFFYLDKYLS